MSTCIYSLHVNYGQEREVMPNLFRHPNIKQTRHLAYGMLKQVQHDSRGYLINFAATHSLSFLWVMYFKPYLRAASVMISRSGVS
jgi:hypothetical protein